VSATARPLDPGGGAARGELGLGFAASVLVHVAVAAAMLFVGVSRPATPPVFRINMSAAAPGAPQMGVVQAQPKAELPKAPAPKTVKTKPPDTKTTTKRTLTPPPVKAATPNMAEPDKPAPPKSVAPTAAGGLVGGKGTDTRVQRTDGLDFPFPEYLEGIIRAVDQQFGGAPAPPVTATVSFTIRRDGSVDPESIKLFVASPNGSYNRRAMGAIESASNLKLFGKLPTGFSDDVLPVYFIFDGRKK
jgi:hypothetical protein